MRNLTMSDFVSTTTAWILVVLTRRYSPAGVFEQIMPLLAVGLMAIAFCVWNTWHFKEMLGWKLTIFQILFAITVPVNAVLFAVFMVLSNPLPFVQKIVPVVIFLVIAGIVYHFRFQFLEKHGLEEYI